MTAALLASGRAADVFEDAPGRVRRVYRDAEHCDVAREARVMAIARDHGFPVPNVLDADDRELVLERVDGPTMLADLARRPWRVRAHARALARLHDELHRIPAPADLPAPLGAGDRLVHLDLHPGNVLLGDCGPVVIDWTDASRGTGADDAAQTWVIVATSVPPGAAPIRALQRGGRRLFLDAFAAAVEADGALDRIPALARRRLTSDPHLLAPERTALERLLAADGTPQTAK